MATIGALVTTLWPVQNYTAWWQRHKVWTTCLRLLHRKARTWTRELWITCMMLYSMPVCSPVLIVMCVDTTDGWWSWSLWSCTCRRNWWHTCSGLQARWALMFWLFFVYVPVCFLLFVQHFKLLAVNYCQILVTFHVIWPLHCIQ